MDYRHHWQDVTAGSFLGLVLAFFAYHQYYPPLSSPMSHRPYNPRTLRRREQNTEVNMMGADVEGGLRVQSRRGSTMDSEEPHGHIQYYSQSRHGPSDSVNSETMPFAYPPPHLVQSSTTLPSHAEVETRSEASGGVPDEERGIPKPVPPKGVQEIWREEREREDGL
jgi:hypothetical protein